jgi:hypothetical protein
MMVNNYKYFNFGYIPSLQEPLAVPFNMEPNFTDDLHFNRMRCCDWTRDRFTRRGSHPIPLNINGENSKNIEKRGNDYAK